MKITCLVDNTAARSSSLWGEHGVAFLIEADGGQVLFDTGQSGVVLTHNMDALGIDPRQVCALAISHAHYDHTGGLPDLLGGTRPSIPLFAHPGLFCARFSRRADGVESIGLPMGRESLEARTTLHLSAEPQEICRGVWTTGEIRLRPAPEGRSAHHLVQDGDGWAPDPYRDDLSLVLEVQTGLALLCGCCHAGLLNTLGHVRDRFEPPVVAVVGGTHLVNASASELEQVATALSEMDGLQGIYLNHCSGEKALRSLSIQLGPDRVHPCPAGTLLDL